MPSLIESIEVLEAIANAHIAEKVIPAIKRLMAAKLTADVPVTDQRILKDMALLADTFEKRGSSVWRAKSGAKIASAGADGIYGLIGGPKTVAAMRDGVPNGRLVRFLKDGRILKAAMDAAKGN